LIEPHKGDKRYVRRKKGNFSAGQIRVGRSLSADRAPVQLIKLHHNANQKAAAAMSELIQIEGSKPTACCHFGALRSDAG
jgi:hypothetical protein